MDYGRELRYQCGRRFMTTNWISTAIGLIAAILNVVAHGANPKQVALSVAIAGLGAVTKDFNK